MLKLYHQSVRCFDVSNVLFAIVCFVNYLLPSFWKTIFPITMPLSLVFSPVITGLFCLVRPMPDFSITTFSDHFSTAARTDA